MTIHLATFATDDMYKSALLGQSSGRANGINHIGIHRLDDLHRSLVYQENRKLFDGTRAHGYWAWKPWIVLETLKFVPDNSYVIYSDAGVEFIDNVKYIIDRMNQDVFLFGNMWEHAHWCKRDIIEAIWPFPIESDNPKDEATIPWIRFGKQVQASVIFFRVNDKTRAFVAEWLHWCLYRPFKVTFPERYLIDDSPSIAPNHPEFQENRHDQAILTTLAYRDGYKLHWWPASYNDGAFIYERGTYPDEGYPALFNHHRRRNSEF